MFRARPFTSGITSTFRTEFVYATGITGIIFKGVRIDEQR